MLFFKRKKKTNIPLPTWEEVVERCYDQGLNVFSDQVIKVIYNPTKSYRVVILKRQDGNYRIAEEKLISCDEYDLSYQSDVWGYWATIDRGISIFDSIDIAEEEAQRLIANFPY